MATTRRLLRAMIEEIFIMQDKIDKLRQQVQRQTDATKAVVTVLNNLAQQIRDAGDDPDEVNALADEVAANADTLAAAVTANTPAEGGGETGATGPAGGETGGEAA